MGLRRLRTSSRPYTGPLVTVVIGGLVVTTAFAAKLREVLDGA